MYRNENRRFFSVTSKGEERLNQQEPTVPQATVEELKSSPYYFEVSDYNRKIDDKHVTEEPVEEKEEVDVATFIGRKLLNTFSAENGSGLWLLAGIVLVALGILCAVLFLILWAAP